MNNGFNSRTREGCDIIIEIIIIIQLFQFTHPRGVRSGSRPRNASGLRFNSRTREGCDEQEVPRRQRRDVSIHAPARGAMCKCIPKQ